MMGTNPGPEVSSTVQARGAGDAPAARGSGDEAGAVQHLALYRTIVESSPDGILVATPDGTIVYCNRALERLFDYGRGELPGRSVDVLVPEASRAFRHAERARSREPWTLRAPGADGVLYGSRRGGGEIAVDVRLASVATADGLCVIATVIDLTTRTPLEDDARRTIEGRLAFESLLADLARLIVARGARQGADGDVAGDALARIGDHMRLDGVTLLPLDGGPRGPRPRHWARASAGARAGVVRARDLRWTHARLRAGTVVTFSTPEDVPEAADRDTYARRGTRAGVAIPVIDADQAAQAVLFESTQARRWSPEVVERLELVAHLVATLFARRESDTTLLQALDETEALRDELEAENVVLRRHSTRLEGTEYIVGQSAAVRQTLRELRQVAPTDATVLLVGETGTGKELFAEHVHALSARHDRPMVRVNCAAIPATLIESELFGREKGAYTGAISRQVGRFELAHHSTIFLDEIGDVPLDVQVKLLRVLEDRHIERLGSSSRVPVDVRVIAATHRDLEKSVAAGEFREDLYYRLNVFPIRVPPLRERTGDIPLLVWRFVSEFSKAFGKRVDAIGNDSMDALMRYPWPGNIRELRNVVERAMIGATGRQLNIAVPPMHGGQLQRSLRLDDVDRHHILSVLDLTHWRIRGEQGAANCLGLKPTTLETRMAKLGIRRAQRQG